MIDHDKSQWWHFTHAPPSCYLHLKKKEEEEKEEEEKKRKEEEEEKKKKQLAPKSVMLQ